MTDTEHDTKALLEKAIAVLPKKTYLIFIERDEAFSDENCAAIIGGKKDNVLENWELFENEWRSIDSYLESALPDDEEREALRDSDDFEAFKDECYARDRSDAYGDILRNTGRKLVRFYIRTSKGERIAMEDGSWQWDDARVEKEAKRLGKAAGLDYEANRDNLRELVCNATYGGVLCIIGYVEMTDVDKWVEHCLEGDERGRIALTFTNPYLLLHDAWNGSGHCVKVTGDIVIRFGRGALDPTHGVMALDAKNVGTGYSWDETSGAYKPAYQADPKDKFYKAKKGQKPDVPAPESWPGR